MVKIYLKGKFDPIMVTESEARQVRQMIDEKKKGFIKVGDLTFEASNIKMIDETSEELIMDKMKDKQKEEHQKYLTSIRQKLALSPEQRAKNCWGHFSLFYWSVTKESPKEEMKSLVERYATAFFKEHPEWSMPSVLLWRTMFEKEQITACNKLDNLQSSGITILEQAERQEVYRINHKMA